FAEFAYLEFGVPVDALAAIAEFVEQGAYRRELAIDVVVVTLHNRHGGRRLAGDQVALAKFPVFRLKRLAQLSRSVVQPRRDRKVFALAQVRAAYIADIPRH